MKGLSSHLQCVLLNQIIIAHFRYCEVSLYIISTAPLHQEVTSLTLNITALRKPYCILDIINANLTLCAAPSHHEFS